MNSSHRFRDIWFWEPEISIALIALSIPVATIMAIILFPDFGLNSGFIFLFFIPLAFLFYCSRKIDNKVKVLEACISAQNGEVVASLLYIKNKSIQGVAILRKDVLILIPIIGRRHKIFFNRLKSIKEIKKIPGKWLPGKRVFNIEFESKPSVAFAVNGSVAKRWAVIFQEIN